VILFRALRTTAWWQWDAEGHGDPS
jgi:hypothetical protein